MIYITGDIHGDFSRFKSPLLRKLRKNDALIVCGDFGFIWNGSEKEKKILKKIGKLPYNVLFVEGSHDNYDLLEDYPEEEWCGGRTRHITGRLRQLMRGQVFEIAEKTVFSFGGGQSDDTVDLIEGENWWRREIPSEHELEEGLRNLEAAGNSAHASIIPNAESNECWICFCSYCSLTGTKTLSHAIIFLFSLFIFL